MKKQKILPIRNIFDFSPRELLKGLRTNLTIEYEDKELKSMTWKEIILQRYLMELNRFKLITDNGFVFDISYIPITSKYCISNFYTEGIFTANTISRFLETLFEDVVKTFSTHEQYNRGLLGQLYEQIANTYNTIYNDIIYNITEYVGSSRLIDFIDIQDNEELLQSMLDVKEVKSTESNSKHNAIQHSYSVLDRILRTDPRYKDNDIRLGYVSGNINNKQVKQLLSCRGFITELDGTIFKYPVYTSFTLGMNSIYDLAIESRAGAKALYTSNKAVQKSEYLARGLQLVTMILERLEDGDCGSKHYIDWYVRPADDQHKSDLPNLLGKRFLNPETGKEEIITKDHKWLEGKTIKMRTILKCLHPDDRAVCHACFGELGHSVPIKANLGHFCSVELSQKITQSILSTKHEMSTAKANEIRLADTTKDYIYVDGNNYFLKPELQKNTNINYKILVNQNESFGLKDLTSQTKIDTIDPTRVSRISSIVLHKENTKTGEVEMIMLPINDANRYGSFTQPFISYVIHNGWKLSGKDQFIIDLNNWSYKKPFIALPELEYSFKALNTDVARLLKNIKHKKNVGSVDSPELLLQKLFNTVNFKLDVNISILEGIIYSFVVQDFEAPDFHIGKYDKNGEPPKRSLFQLHEIVTSRSLGAAYGWERLEDLLKEPKIFNNNNAIDHPMDVVIKPDDVVRKYYSK